MVTKIISVLSAKHLANHFSCALVFSHFIVSFKVFEICAADAFFFHTSVAGKLQFRQTFILSIPSAVTEYLRPVTWLPGEDSGALLTSAWESGVHCVSGSSGDRNDAPRRVYRVAGTVQPNRKQTERPLHLQSGEQQGEISQPGKIPRLGKFASGQPTSHSLLRKLY